MRPSLLERTHHDLEPDESSAVRKRAPNQRRTETVGESLKALPSPNLAEAVGHRRELRLRGRRVRRWEKVGLELRLDH